MNDTPRMRAARFRQEAGQIRAFANGASVPALRRELLDIAERYERLAERAEKGQVDPA